MAVGLLLVLLVLSAIMIRKLNQIHALTNSNLTKVQADLKSARGQIEELQIIVGFIASATKGPDGAE